jgi:hypothetical protein
MDIIGVYLLHDTFVLIGLEVGHAYLQIDNLIFFAKNNIAKRGGEI